MDLITIAAIAIALYNLILILVVIAWCCFILGCKPYRGRWSSRCVIGWNRWEKWASSSQSHHRGCAWGVDLSTNPFLFCNFIVAINMIIASTFDFRNFSWCPWSEIHTNYLFRKIFFNFVPRIHLQFYYKSTSWRWVFAVSGFYAIRWHFDNHFFGSIIAMVKRMI